MHFLGFSYLNASITALVVIYVFVCLAMIFLVLMQRPKQEGLGAAFGASTTDQLFGARTTNVLQRGTVYLAVMFFVLTFALAVLVQKKNKIASLANAPAAPAAEQVAPAPAKSLIDELPVTQETPEKPAEETPAPTPEPQPEAETEKPAEEAAQPEAQVEPSAEEDKTPQQ
jgi:preprotein translocase subunit SecG